LPGYLMRDPGKLWGLERLKKSLMNYALGFTDCRI